LPGRLKKSGYIFIEKNWEYTPFPASRRYRLSCQVGQIQWTNNGDEVIIIIIITLFKCQKNDSSIKPLCVCSTSQDGVTNHFAKAYGIWQIDRRVMGFRNILPGKNGIEKPIQNPNGIWN
jgi:hypothetical protein